MPEYSPCERATNNIRPVRNVTSQEEKGKKTQKSSGVYLLCVHIRSYTCSRVGACEVYVEISPRQGLIVLSLEGA